MKTLYGFLGATLMAVSLISAAPAMSNCDCEICDCTQESHCGCFSESSCGCGSMTCACGDCCNCSENSSCESDCDCN